MLARKMILEVALLLCVAFIVPALATTYYVDPNGNDSNDGQSWATAFVTIQKGINTAISGDIVTVAEGTYQEAILINKAGITVTSTDPENWNVVRATIIRGDESGPTVRFADWSGGNGPILTGFTVTNGKKGISFENQGGGVDKVKRCLITDNMAGVNIDVYGQVDMENCIISNNSPKVYGDGGGVQIGAYHTCSANFVNCVIADNYGDSYSGGVRCFSNTEKLTFKNCTFKGNRSPSGGVIVRIWECNSREPNVTFENCIMWSIPGECTIIGKYEDDCWPGSGSGCIVNVNYCDIQGGYPGQGNIDEDPQFTGDEGFQLGPNSPCINAGDPNGNYNNQHDIDGGARICGSRADIGADEIRAVWYVKADANGTGDGRSWENAFTTVQDAVNAASDTNDDVIILAQGTYQESVDMGTKVVTLQSSEPQNTNVVDATIIDGYGGNYCVRMGSGSTLYGLTATNANIGIDCNQSNVTIINCAVKNNDYGLRFLQGASGKATNLRVLRNGYGIYLSNADSFKFTNDTVLNNTTAGVYVASGAVPQINNCILWNNSDDLYGCNATYSCIEDGDTGTGNISNNPMFADPNGDGCHIDTYSPCIDSGDPCADYRDLLKDIDGGPRVQGTTADIGADEADPIIGVSTSPIDIVLYEGQTISYPLVISNTGGTDLNFDIWPSNPRGLPDTKQTAEEAKALSFQATRSYDNIVIDYEFNEPVFTKSGDYDVVAIPWLRTYAQVGAPIVPSQMAKLLVPYGKKVADVKVEVLAEQKLTGRYYLAPAQREYPLNYTGKIEPTMPDSTIYSSNKSWPGSYCMNVTTQSKRGHQLCYASILPVQYKPKSGQITYASKMRLTVKLDDVTILKKEPKPTKGLQAYLKQAVDNPEALATYSSQNMIQPSAIVKGQLNQAEGITSLPGGSHKYVIITNEYLRDNTPEPWNFQKLRDSKLARGISATIVTTEWIYANYDGNKPSGDSDNQTKIRNFLIDAYNNWGTEYVLLGGAKNIIPVRYFSADNWFTTYSIPCDMYYGCVDTPDCNFDYNGDGFYGYMDDGVNGGEIDLTADIYVGRAGVETTDEVSNFVKKTLTYNANISGYLPRVTMLGETITENINFFGSRYMEEIRCGAASNFLYGATNWFPGGFTKHKCENFYDFNTSINLYAYRDSNGIIQEWNASDIISVIDNGVHILNHLGHGSSYGTMHLIPSDIGNMANEDYFFAYSQACNAGDFGANSCFAEKLTVGEHGAFAAVMNSNLGFGSTTTWAPSQYFNRSFWDTVFDPDPDSRIMELGAALQISKERYGVQEWPDACRITYFELNLFGDPEQQLLLGQSRDSAWAEAEPGDGIINDHNSTSVDVHFNAKILPHGDTYHGNIIIRSNDYNNPIVNIPVSMTVLPSPMPDAHLWKLDETSGTTAYDSIDTNNGTFNGNDPCWVDGFIGGAVDLNGISDYFSVPTLDTAYNYNSTFTVVGWFKTSQSTGMQTIIGQWGQNYYYYGWQVLVESNKVVARFGDASPSVSDITGTSDVVNDANWHHFALVYPTKDVNAVLYVDGQSQGTPGKKFFLSVSTLTKFRIGDGSYVISGTPVLKGGPFCGTIDDVMIFNRALTAGEVQQLYHEGLANKAYNYNPAKATGVNINTDLSWTAGERATSHDVYFGTTNSPPYIQNQQGTSYDPGTLTNGTTYYWRIDEKNSVGTTTGDVWSFTTIYTQTLTCSSTDGGNVTTPGEGAFPYDHGTDANIVATADSNYRFVKWTGTAVTAGKVTNPNSASTKVTMDADYTVMASFLINPDAHWWKLDETSGTTAYDSVGTTNGTFNGSDPCWVTGHIGGAVDFNGVSDYFTISGLNPGTDYNDLDTFTVAGWFKTSQSTGMQTIIGQWGQIAVPTDYPNSISIYCGWQVLVESNKVVARFGPGSITLTDITGTRNVNDGNWHYFTLVYPTKNSNATLYVDGNSEGTPGAKPFTVGSASSRIGDGSYAISYGGSPPPVMKGGPFCGMIDGVMIYNCALTANEVLQLYISDR